MKKTLFALVLMAGSTFAQAPYAAGPGVGAPGYDPSQGAYPEPGQDPYAMGAGPYAAPVACAPGSIWIDGYTDANGYFVNGYCTVPPFSGAYWVAPTFFGGRFVAGYWGHGRVGYAPGFAFRGGFAGNGGFRGGFAAAPHFAPAPRVNGGFGNGFHAPAAAPSFHPQGGFRGGGSPMHSGGSGHGGRR